MAKSVREIGDKFAEEICRYMNSRLSEKNQLRLTKNSGATHRDTDFKNDMVGIDCKTSDVFRQSDLPASIKSADVKKTTEQASETSRIGITVTDTRDGIIASLSLDDLIILMDK